MDIMKIGAQLLASKLGGGADSSQITDMLSGLIGGNSGQGLDFGNLISGLQSNGLGDVAQSWLGDGENADISEEQIEGVLGAEKIQEMASQLGTNQGLSLIHI